MSTGGEGGMVTTNDKALWSSMWSFKDHGKSWAAVYDGQHGPGFRWVHESFGTNWRMLEMQAAIGRIQLKRMSGWTMQRTQNANKIAEMCRRFAVVRVPPIPNAIQHAFYKFYVFVRPDKFAAGWTRDRIIAEIVAEGVPCYYGTCPEIYLEKAFAGTAFAPPERLPIAKNLGETSLMFLVHPTLTATELEKVCQVISMVFGRASR